MRGNGREDYHVFIFTRLRGRVAKGHGSIGFSSPRQLRFSISKATSLPAAVGGPWAGRVERLASQTQKYINAIPPSAGIASWPAAIFHVHHLDNEDSLFPRFFFTCLSITAPSLHACHVDQVFLFGHPRCFHQAG